MPRKVDGVYRNGKIELLEPLEGVAEETPVVVTFLDSGGIDLRTLGIDEAQAADMRARLASFAEEWDSPEMDIYDDYDNAKSRL